LPFRGKILASLFQSITPRTAGFSTLNTANLNPTTLLLLIVLMFIGASPGGTGGGVKTTTFAVALLLIISSYKEETSLVIFGRTISLKTIKR